MQLREAQPVENVAVHVGLDREEAERELSGARARQTRQMQPSGWENAAMLLCLDQAGRTAGGGRCGAVERCRWGNAAKLEWDGRVACGTPMKSERRPPA